MKTLMTAGAALLMSTTLVQAVGLDRSNQNVGVLFEETGATGSYVELSYGMIMPSVDGTDVLAFGGRDSGNVAEDFNQIGLGFKQQYTDAFSASFILDQPYGANIAYPTGNSLALGGTKAELDSEAISMIGRYEMGNGFSVHGGLRVQTISADITLGGGAYGGAPPAGLTGYNVSLAEDTQVGYVVGAAYERPDIALRVALTYFSEIDHTFDVRENFSPGVTSQTNVTTPQAINLDFQSGVAADTLVFGSIRWADYDEVLLSPAVFNRSTGGASLTNIETNFSYSIGVGRRFTDNFSGSLSLGYDASGADDLVSPLAPTNGNFSVAVGGAYTFDTGIELSGGIRYVMIGDAQPETGTPDIARASFTDNDAVGLGLKIAYAF